jgi:hypothetical protein
VTCSNTANNRCGSFAAPASRTSNSSLSGVAGNREITESTAFNARCTSFRRRAWDSACLNVRHASSNFPYAVSSNAEDSVASHDCCSVALRTSSDCTRSAQESTPRSRTGLGVVRDERRHLVPMRAVWTDKLETHDRCQNNHCPTNPSSHIAPVNLHGTTVPRTIWFPNAALENGDESRSSGTIDGKGDRLRPDAKATDRIAGGCSDVGQSSKLASFSSRVSEARTLAIQGFGTTTW